MVDDATSKLSRGSCKVYLCMQRLLEAYKTPFKFHTEVLLDPDHVQILSSLWKQAPSNKVTDSELVITIVILVIF